MALTDKQNILLQVLADGAFHSGTELAMQLQVSRSAVWKQLTGLQDLGLKLMAVRGKGYRLSEPLELLDAAFLYSALPAPLRSLVSQLEVHTQIDSTNLYLSRLASVGAASGHICFAEQQTAGKGRRGRAWVSPLACNLYLSLLWRFPRGFASLSGLSLAMGVAVIRALRQHGIVGVGLKWPNDLVSGGKKLGGILIEVSGESEGPIAVVIGLGININMPQENGQDIGQPWTDIARIAPDCLQGRNALAAALLTQLLTVLAEYAEQGLTAYLPEWRQADALLGEKVALYVGDQVTPGWVQGVDDNGLLLLRLNDGTVKAYASGEVSFSPGPS